MPTCNFAYKDSILSLSTVVANYSRYVYVAMYNLIYNISIIIAIMLIIKSNGLIVGWYSSSPSYPVAKLFILEGSIYKLLHFQETLVNI